MSATPTRALSSCMKLKLAAAVLYSLTYLYDSIPNS